MKAHAAMLTFLFCLTAKAAAPSSNCDLLLSDPHQWLEEVSSKDSMSWVNNQNTRTKNVLESDPEYSRILTDLKSVKLATDRKPFSTFSHGYFWNFWQDETHKQGVLRRTTYEEYLKPNPKWDVMLDLDALSKAEGETWVYKGYYSLTPGSSRALMTLSRGGSDAIVIREYDFETKKFINEGFNILEEGLHSVSPLDENTVYVATALKDDELTTSESPRVVRVWKRGRPLSEARKVFETSKSDLMAFAYRFDHGKEKYMTIINFSSMDEQQSYLVESEESVRPLPMPSTSSLFMIKGKQIYFRINQNLKIGRKEFKAGSLLRLGLEEKSLESSILVWEPARGQSLGDVSVRENSVMITILDNITSKLLELKPNGTSKYQVKELPLPKNGIIKFSDRMDSDPTSFATFTYEGFLTPESEYRLIEEGGGYRFEKMLQEKNHFDGQLYEVAQMFSTSKDGTKVPYFIIKRKDLVLDGTIPTLLYGYGGFNESLTPYYLGAVGKTWLERGGVYVIANIRGGGEFGPEWHQAALRENKQKSYDDFISIAEDLIAKKITSPKHLGIKGGSNGGLLVGAVMTQRPELFNAALIQVPLLDMIRYTKLLAGSSWISEYGDPDVEGDKEFILKYSPYHNLYKDKSYPTPLFTTSTKDDRVHPAHARKMAARMMELGHEVLYFENTEGGHNGAANLNQGVELQALEYTYLWRQLSGE